MNLLAFVDKLVSTFSKFNDLEKVEIKTDIALISYEKFIFYLALEKSAFVEKLKQAFESKEIEQIEMVMKEILLDENLAFKFSLIARETVQDWLEDVSAEFNEDDKAIAQDVLVQLRAIN